MAKADQDKTQTSIMIPLPAPSGERLGNNLPNVVA